MQRWVGQILVVIAGFVLPLWTTPADPSIDATGNSGRFIRQAHVWADTHLNNPLQRFLILRYTVSVEDPPLGHVPEPWEGACEAETGGGPTAIVTAHGWWWIPVAGVLVECDGARTLQNDAPLAHPSMTLTPARFACLIQ